MPPLLLGRGILGDYEVLLEDQRQSENSFYNSFILQ